MYYCDIQCGVWQYREIEIVQDSKMKCVQTFETNKFTSTLPRDKSCLSSGCVLCGGTSLYCSTGVGNDGADTADRALLGLWNNRRICPSLALVL